MDSDQIPSLMVHSLYQSIIALVSMLYNYCTKKQPLLVAMSVLGDQLLKSSLHTFNIYYIYNINYIYALLINTNKQEANGWWGTITTMLDKRIDHLQRTRFQSYVEIIYIVFLSLHSNGRRKYNSSMFNS